MEFVSPTAAERQLSKPSSEFTDRSSDENDAPTRPFDQAS
jgi:hypothetical protein